ncbi:unnamed protein product [Amoebophrya sp. A120]|nr:unnamed protein product [Amoebophrya sp. A120]|eukprot:GSA120T00022704001.1
MWNMKKEAAPAEPPKGTEPPSKATLELIWKVQMLFGFAGLCAAMQVVGDLTGMIERF